MKMRYITLIVSLCSAISLFGQSFPEIETKAKKLKEDGNYLEASRSFHKYRINNKLHGKQLLDAMLPEAECYYLLDDYQQLDSMLAAYIECFRASRAELGDSLDVYKAYLHKLLGNSSYSRVDDETVGGWIAQFAADKHYSQSLKTFEGRNSTENAIVLHQDLAQLKYKAKDYGEAYDHLKVVYDYYENRIGLGISSDEPHYYSVMALLAICNARNASLEENDDVSKEMFEHSLGLIEKSIAYRVKKKDVEYYDRVRIKGKILMMMFDRLNIDKIKDAKECYVQYVNYQRKTVGERLSKMTESQQEQNWMAMHQFLFDCYRLGNNSPEMLYDLALFSKNYLLVNKQTDDVKWQQVRKALKDEDCAIEFIQYNATNEESRLGCLILKKGYKVPKFLDISSTDSILLKRIDDDLNVYKAMTCQPPRTGDYRYKNYLYTDTVLFNMIWTPELMEEIGTAKRVYFSPDGMLHQLAIEYMMPDEGKICYRLSSTRVLTQKREPLNHSKILVCGGMDYNSVIAPKTRGNDVTAYNYFAGSGSPNDLPSTLLEVHSIINARKNPLDTLLTGKDATDENFMELLKRRYPLIHISTHGYFAGEMYSGTDLKPATTDNTMSKSGLIFAGVTSATTDKNFDKNLFDGILSASEISKFDMSGVEFVSLSACQTALGTITSDGIFGMQRALKMAGAKSMMVSLWSVGDESSYLLFKYFYEILENQPDKDIHAAWMAARQKLKETKIKNIVFNRLTLNDEVKYRSFETPVDLNPYIMIDVF